MLCGKLHGNADLAQSPASLAGASAVGDARPRMASQPPKRPSKPPEPEPPGVSRYWAGAAGALAVLVGVGFGTYRHFARESREISKELLVGVASNRVTTLRAHLDERMADTALLAEHREVEQSVDDVLGAGARDEARSIAQATLRQSMLAYRYHSARVFDAAGAVVVSVGDVAPGPVAREAVAEALRTGRSAFVPLASALDGVTTYGAASPVIVRGVVRGAVLLEMDAARMLYPLLRDAVTGRATVEGELFQRSGDAAMLVVSTRASVAASAVPSNRMRDRALLAARAGAVSSPEVAEARDYRDVDVLAALAPVPRSPWVVVAKIDRAEAEAPVVTLSFIVAGSVLFAAALVAALARALWSKRSAELERLNARLAARTQRVVQASTDGYAVMDAAGRILEVNDGFCAMSGYDEAELVGRPMAEFVVEGDAKGFAEIRASIEQSGRMRFSTEWRRKDGVVRDIDVSTVALGDEGQIAGFARDVSDERAAQRRLERVNRLYALLNHAGEQLFVADGLEVAFERLCEAAAASEDLSLAWAATVDRAAGVLVPVTAHGAGATEVLRTRMVLDPNEVSGRGSAAVAARTAKTQVIDDLTTDPRTAAWASVAIANRNLSSVCVPVTDGSEVIGILAFYARLPSYFDAEVVAIFEELARLLGVVHQRAVERGRRLRSEERFRGLFDAVPLPIMVSRLAEGTILDLNVAFQQTYGWTLDDLPTVEQCFAHLFPDPAVRSRNLAFAAQDFEAVAKGRPVHTPELRVTCRDGTERTVVGHMSMVGGDLLVAWVDLTELRANQALAVEAQAIGRLGGWAYDFATKCMRCSESVQQLIGLAGDAGPRDHDLFDMLPDGERQRILALWERAVEAWEPFDEVARVATTAGLDMHGRIRAQVVYGPDDRPVRAVGSLQDVSREVEVQRELQRHREHLEELVAARTTQLAQANTILRRADQRLKSMLRLSQRASGLAEKQILELCIDEAVRLTGSEVGYVHLVDEAAGRVSLGAWSLSVRAQCAVLAGQHFDLATPGVWADAVREGGPVTHNDFAAIPVRAGYPDGHVPVRRHLAVPFVDGAATRLLLGVGNKPSAYDDIDAQELQLIAMDVWSIVQRRRNEIALEEAFKQVRESDQRFQYAMDAASEGLWDADLAHGTAFFSQSCFTMLGYASGSIPPTKEAVDALIHRDDADAPRRLVEALFATGTCDVEFRLRDADGAWRWMRSRGRVVEHGPDGRPLRAVGTHSDQTARREQEARLVAAMEAATQANKAKSAFLATMSHEIRTPLNGVLGMAEILAQADLPPRELDAVRTIQASGRTLLGVIDDILDFSKIEAGRLELDPTDVVLRDLVEDLCASLVGVAASRDVDLYAFVAPELVAKVRVDPMRLRQVLYNLTGNAIKFSGRRVGGRGRVEVAVEPPPDGAAGIVLRVVDNGIGMSDEVLGKLFTSFTQGETSTTRRFGGTGLGLAITRRLVDFMGGSIEVASAPGKGSTFIVRLPLESSRSQPATVRPDLHGLDVVVVDGARSFDAGHVARHLEAAGAQVKRGADEAAVADVARALQRLCVVVHGERFEPAMLLRYYEGDDLVRHLAFVPGERARVRVAHPQVVTVECDLLRASRLLHAVAVAAGRQSPGPALHADDPAPADGPTQQSVIEARASGELILVAEDDAVNQKVIVQQLELLGYACEVASNGVDALVLHRRRRHALLLTDLHMPEMDGYSLAREIRRGEAPGERMPILALTANALRGEAARAQAAGMDGYLTKPVQLSTLGSTLRLWLGSGSGAHPAGVVAEVPGSVPPPANDVVLDVSVLESLVGNDRAVVREFLLDYRSNADSLGRALVAAHAAGDDAEVGRLAHKLKSSSKSVGALKLGGLCADLEEKAKLRRKMELDDVVGRFEVHLATVLRAIDVAMNRP